MTNKALMEETAEKARVAIPDLQCEWITDWEGMRDRHVPLHMEDSYGTAKFSIGEHHYALGMKAEDLELFPEHIRRRTMEMAIIQLLNRVLTGE